MTVALSDARAVCTSTLERGSKSFALAGRLLPGRLFDDAATLYTFCRRVDDAVDDAGPEDAQRALDAMRLRVRSIYRAEAQEDPFWQRFAELTTRVRLPERYVNELFSGMQMDIDGARYRTSTELFAYCHRVAGVVGLMMCHVFGVTRDEALVNAAHLGIALQLTNIARDVEEDFRLGRVYVPRALLGRDLIPEPRALTRAEADDLAPAVRELLRISEAFYASGDRGMSALPFRARLAVRCARLVYSEIGARVLARGCDVLRGRVVVSTARKLALLGVALWRTLRESLSLRKAAVARTPKRVLGFPEDVLTPEFEVNS